MKVALCFFTLVLLGGCGKSTESGANGVVIPATQTPSENINPGTDPELSVLPDSTEDNDHRRCEPVLISENVAMLTVECLPEELRDGRSRSCGKHMEFIFTLPSGVKKRSCKKIHFDEYSEDGDKVIIELN